MTGAHRRQQPPPHPPLHAPFQARRDPPHLPFLDRVPSFHRGLQEQDRLLDVRGKIQQVHDLRGPGPRDVTEPGDVGVVLDVTLLEEIFEANRQGHEPADPRDAAGWWGSRL